MVGIDALLEPMYEALAAKNAARETALSISRQLVRVSANSIRATHRGDRAEADEGLDQGAKLADELKAATAGHPDIYHTGYTQDALKEWVEAHATAALINGEPIPSAAVVGGEAGAYLNGLGEAIGEMRRAILDAILRAEVDRAQELLSLAEDIQGALMTFDYPDALTSGLRRTTDAMRGLLERTRGDVVTAVRQARLEASLKAAEER